MSEIQTVIMGFSGLWLGSALEETIVELAKFHQGESLAWLDQMEESFISNVKNSPPEGLALDVELKAMEGAILRPPFYVSNLLGDISMSDDVVRILSIDGGGIRGI